MHKATISLLSAALSAAALVGCSKKAPESAPTPSPTAARPAAGDSVAKYGAAQPSAAPGMIEVGRQEIQTRRNEIITAALPMTAAQGERFWPLYRQYRADVQKLNDRTLDILTQYAARGGSLDDATATKLLNEYLANEKKRIELQQSWVPKFEQVLPGASVARFYQIENKLDAAVMYDLAGGIPLVERKSQ